MRRLWLRREAAAAEQYLEAEELEKGEKVGKEGKEEEDAEQQRLPNFVMRFYVIWDFIVWAACDRLASLSGRIWYSSIQL